MNADFRIDFLKTFDILLTPFGSIHGHFRVPWGTTVTTPGGVAAVRRPVAAVSYKNKHCVTLGSSNFVALLCAAYTILLEKTI